MTEHVLERSQTLPVRVEQAFGLFAEAENLEAITPGFLRFRIVTPTPIEMEVGALIRYRLRLRGIPISWLTRIDEWDPPHRFVDRQLRGPYSLWHHTHSFEALDPERTSITDRVRYALPLGPIGELAHALVVRRDLERIFDHRHERIEGLLAEEDDRG